MRESRLVPPQVCSQRLSVCNLIFSGNWSRPTIKRVQVSSIVCANNIYQLLPLTLCSKCGIFIAAAIIWRFFPISAGFWWAPSLDVCCTRKGKVCFPQSTKSGFPQLHFAEDIPSGSTSAVRWLCTDLSTFFLRYSKFFDANFSHGCENSVQNKCLTVKFPILS